MTRSPGPRLPCPVCGRVVGTYYPAIPVTVGHVRTIQHRELTQAQLVRVLSHKAAPGPRCPGGEVKPDA